MSKHPVINFGIYWHNQYKGDGSILGTRVHIYIILSCVTLSLYLTQFFLHFWEVTQDSLAVSFIFLMGNVIQYSRISIEWGIMDIMKGMIRTSQFWRWLLISSVHCLRFGTLWNSFAIGFACLSTYSECVFIKCGNSILKCTYHDAFWFMCDSIKFHDMKLEQMLTMEEQYLKLFYLSPCLDT